ncbi:MAG: YdcF family protein [Planctomycetaceae bacterium]|nr:YdcF family protein [Planctomycetaceae bacterium]
MESRRLLTICGRSLLSGATLIVALTSGASAMSALRWQRAAEPCVWISNPLGGGEWASVAWNAGLMVLLGFAAAGVLIRELPPRWTRAVRIGLLALALRAVFDVAMFFRLVANGEIASSFPVPLSLGVLIVIVADIGLMRHTTPSAHSRSWVMTLLSVGGVVLGQVVMIGLHVLTFGSTDYRRDADVAVVLGARVFPDGRLSLALSDRLDTAAELFREGRVRFVLVSGATGVEGVNEAGAMRGYLLDAGLPEDRILFDPEGVNTLATARNSRRLMGEQRLTSALIVSHYFHLARCKLLFEEQGLAAVTVPARMSRRLVLEAYYVFRECVGYLWYALTRPLRPIVPT